jgi:hypothetical protein
MCTVLPQHPGVRGHMYIPWIDCICRQRCVARNIWHLADQRPAVLAYHKTTIYDSLRPYWSSHTVIHTHILSCRLLMYGPCK